MRNQITRLRYMVLWVKIGVLTPWTFHPFSNLVCYLVALMGIVVYPLSPIFFGCLVLSNFSCHVLLSVRKLAGEVTSSQDASWRVGSKTIVVPVFFFSGVLIMISVFFSWPWNCGIYPNLPGESGSCWWNLWKPNGGYLPSMAIEIGEHSCRRKTDGICMNVLLPKLVFFFCFFNVFLPSDISTGEELALMVLSFLSPCSHLELVIGCHGGFGGLVSPWNFWWLGKHHVIPMGFL